MISGFRLWILFLASSAATAAAAVAATTAQQTGAINTGDGGASAGTAAASNPDEGSLLSSPAAPAAEAAAATAAVGGIESGAHYELDLERQRSASSGSFADAWSADERKSEFGEVIAAAPSGGEEAAPFLRIKRHQQQQQQQVNISARQSSGGERGRPASWRSTAGGSIVEVGDDGADEKVQHNQRHHESKQVTQAAVAAATTTGQRSSREESNKPEPPPPEPRGQTLLSGAATQPRGKGPVVYTNQFVIEVEGGEEEAKKLAAKHGFVYLNHILADFYHLEHRRLSKRSLSADQDLADISIRDEPQVSFALFSIVVIIVVVVFRVPLSVFPYVWLCARILVVEPTSVSQSAGCWLAAG